MSKKAILIVDDDNGVRNLEKTIVSRVLEELGRDDWRLETFVNGQEAWNRIKQEKFECLILISDIEMPEMDGVELSRKVRNRLPGAKIIALSGNPEKEEKVQKADYFFKKPFSVKELKAVVSGLIRN